MKFLILPAETRDDAAARKDRRTRLFLEDGTELTELLSVEAQEGYRSVQVVPLGDQVTPRAARRIEMLTLTFLHPEVEFIDSAPAKRKVRL